jgi:hypothetical protein
MDAETFTVLFEYEVPAFTMHLITIVEHSHMCGDCAPLSTLKSVTGVIENGPIRVHLTDTKLIESIEDTEFGRTQSVNQAFVRFGVSVHSGAAIFMPERKAYPLALTVDSVIAQTGDIGTFAVITYHR